MNSRVRAGSIEELSAAGSLVISTERGEICIVTDGTFIYALDNNCSHMGSQIHKGEVVDGHIVCPWHRARFELATGKGLDLYAPDISSYAIQIEDGGIFVDLSPNSFTRLESPSEPPYST